jgi:mono/diheme cytochrome c family protein
VKAVGIAGAGAVAQVGRFHPGGPLHEKEAFAAYTAPGRVLHADRVLVASGSNFGAPPALPGQAEGSVLSLDPDGPALVVPPRFAEAGDQASAADLRILLYAAQSPAFLNRIHTPGAASADQASVSNPLGISLNNAFGRVWIANAPFGSDGIGTLSIDDPTGEPLANGFSPVFGGVYASHATNRPDQTVPGSLDTGAVATALIGFSPDGSRRAVFAVLTADGAIAQAHAEGGLDGLAPPGTIAPLEIPAVPDPARPITRAGMIFNWVPDGILYIAEPSTDAIVAISLAENERAFAVARVERFTPPELSAPVDLAPAIGEVANREFSSNTTLAGRADFYVANRGNGTVVRMRQDGTVVAVRRIVLPDGTAVGANQLNGIAVSPGAETLWLTLSGSIAGHPDAPGVLLEAPAFGADPVDAAAAGQDGLIAAGEALFAHAFTVSEGLGPLFNATACIECHQSPTAGGMGRDGLGLAMRVGRLDGDGFDPLAGRGGPVARARSVAEMEVDCDLHPGPPPGANVVSLRNAPALYGVGWIDTIADETIRAGAAVRPDLNGRVNVVTGTDGSERVGRFGWKAGTASLDDFIGRAFRNELGLTNPVEPADLVASDACDGPSLAVSDDGAIVRAVAAYVAALPPPAAPTASDNGPGARLFAATGCSGCHTPALAGAMGAVALYSDLLIHDMGGSLADGVTEGRASGLDWRTTPLWGLGLRQRFLHDGRATSIEEAILAHGGDAAAARTAFRDLPEADEAALLDFLSGL